MGASDTGDKTTPRGEARRQAMLDAAWEAVIEKGFAAATLSDILDRSGGSKATLYASFGDKEGLLQEAVQRRIHDFFEQLHIALKPDSDPETVLRRFARTYAERTVEPDAIRFHHLMASENQHLGPIMLGFLDEARCQDQLHLAAYLGTLTEAGLLAVDDPQQAADLFMAMLQGPCILHYFAHTLSGVALEVHKTEVRARAEAAVDLFLKATRPG